MSNQTIEFWNQFTAQMNAISKDLKPEIADAKRQKIIDEFGPQILTAKGNLLKDADDLESQRKKLQDPMHNLSISALNSTDLSRDGYALTRAIPHMDMRMVKTIATETQRPAIQIALLNRASMDNDATLKKTILDNVPVPKERIRGLASHEKTALETLIKSPAPYQVHAAQKLEYAHRVNDLNKLFA